MNVLKLTLCRLRDYQLQLLWNGMAMISWNDSGFEAEQLDQRNPEALACCLHIMAREAAAAATVYGYKPGPVPEEQELKDYFRVLALPWEYSAAIESIIGAMQYGNSRDYMPKENGVIDIDTIELKKN